MNLNENGDIAIIGLGYVGLPLAVEFAKIRNVIGFDIDENRIQELLAGEDRTREMTSEGLASAENLHLTSNLENLRCASIYIVTVPSPIDANNRPDLTPLLRASDAVGRVIEAGNLVIFESTVYPGCTEEECVPVIENISSLVMNRDFFVGYSPERINPGDKERTLRTITKVTSGSNAEAATVVDNLYASILDVPTHKAESIKVAEAAKVIENTQRDLNIALINELAIIFDKLNIDTEAVLTAAATKWNFLPFQPGLVGGHCIGVDPYYLTHKAEAIGYHPHIILSGRRVNDGMAEHVARKLVKEMLSRSIPVGQSKVLILGLTFKENCPDLRNTQVIKILKELEEFGVTADIFDPNVEPGNALLTYGIELCEEPRCQYYDAILIAVAHKQFKLLSVQDIRAWGREGHVLYDIKNMLPRGEADLRL